MVLVVGSWRRARKIATASPARNRKAKMPMTYKHKVQGSITLSHVDHSRRLPLVLEFDSNEW